MELNEAETQGATDKPQEQEDATISLFILAHAARSSSLK
jgi:hypothetical protein